MVVNWWSIIARVERFIKNFLVGRLFFYSGGFRSILLLKGFQGKSRYRECRVCGVVSSVYFFVVIGVRCCFVFDFLKVNFGSAFETFAGAYLCLGEHILWAIVNSELVFAFFVLASVFDSHSVVASVNAEHLVEVSVSCSLGGGGFSCKDIF
jgi:hypothetical protein